MPRVTNGYPPVNHIPARPVQGPNTYTLFWLDGTREVIYGEGIEDAFAKAGYGGGAVRALDMYRHGNNIEYRWDAPKRVWVRDITLLEGTD